MTTSVWRSVLLALFTFLLPLQTLADNRETTTLEARGTGASRDAAIAAALTDAVRQVRGQQLPGRELQAMFLDSMREERMVRMTVLEDYRVRATRLSTAVAFVQDYQILEATRDRKSGEWQARVQADVVDPQKRLARRQESLSLSVLPFTFMQEEEAEAGGPETQMLLKKTLDEIRRFRGLVSAKLDGQSRVAVHEVGSDAGEAFDKAVNMPGEADWKGFAAQSGAGHFVTVQAEEFRLDAVELRRGVKSGRLDGKFVLHYRVVRTTGEQPEVIKSGTFSIDTHHPRLKPLALGGADPTNEAGLRKRLNESFGIVAGLFADTLLSELVPPEIVAREGDNILLQSGAKPLRTGEQIAVIGPDSVAPDAALGLLVRKDGIRIALLQVTSAEEGQVLAKVVKGNAFGVQPGSLVRRLANPDLAGTSK